MESSHVNVDMVVVGGGIAGVTCAQQLCHLNPGKSVAIVSASPVLKVVADVVKITKTIEEFSVSETKASSLEKQFDNLTVKVAAAVEFDPEKKQIILSDGQTVEYGKLCISTGATPSRVFSDERNVLVIRDTESVDTLREKLSSAKSMVIIGNGGIATELVHKIKDCEIYWVIRQDSIGATFVDAGAAQFFLKSDPGDAEGSSQEDACPIYKRMRYTIAEDGDKMVDFGTALGPDWAERNVLKGCSQKNLHIEYETEVTSVTYAEAEAQNIVTLSNGKVLKVDFVLSAIGVEPNTACFGERLTLSEDGAIVVNENFETSAADVFAAGDVCSLLGDEELWFQMRLWTQARQMGDAAARSMSGPDNLIPPYFEVFTHATHFFGYKVVLLGLFNAQKMRGQEYDILLRITPQREYVKLILKGGRLKGAILIGETDLEEVMENLHYSQLDLTDLKDNLLDPDIDLEDYFD